MLSNRAGQRIAVIVNDMSEVNIDDEFVRQDGGLTGAKKRCVERTNGCTLREDIPTRLDACLVGDPDRFTPGGVVTPAGPIPPPGLLVPHEAKHARSTTRPDARRS